MMSKTQYKITVETTTGSHNVTVWPNQHIQAVLAEVLARQGIAKNIDSYDLVWNQQQLNPLDLVRSAGIHEGDTVYLEANPVSI